MTATVFVGGFLCLFVFGILLSICLEQRRRADAAEAECRKAHCRVALLSQLTDLQQRRLEQIRRAGGWSDFVAAWESATGGAPVLSDDGRRELMSRQESPR